MSRRHQRVLASQLKHASDGHDDVDEDEDIPEVTKATKSFSLLAASSSEDEAEDTSDGEEGVKCVLGGASGVAAAENSEAVGEEVEVAEREKKGKKSKAKGKGGKKKVKGAERGSTSGSTIGGGGGGDDRPLVNKDIIVVGTTRDDLNGLRGRVLDYNSSTGRYTIRLKASVGGFLSEVALKPENVTDAALVDRAAALAEEERLGGGTMVRLRFRRTPFGTCDHTVRVGSGRTVLSLKEALVKRIYSDTGVDDGLTATNIDVLVKGRPISDEETVASAGIENNARLGFRRKAQAEGAADAPPTGAAAATAAGAASGGGGAGGGSEVPTPPPLPRQPSAEETAALPYGGNVQKATAAGDRAAIRVIFEARRRAEQGVASSPPDGGSGGGIGGGGSGGVAGAAASGGAGGVADGVAGVVDGSAAGSGRLGALEAALFEAEDRVERLEARAAGAVGASGVDASSPALGSSAGSAGSVGSAGSATSADFSGRGGKRGLSEAATQELLLLDALPMHPDEVFGAAGAAHPDAELLAALRAVRKELYGRVLAVAQRVA